MRNVADRSFTESQNTRFMFSNLFPPKMVPFIHELIFNLILKHITQMHMLLYVLNILI
jgi:hypothetical protein